MQDLLRLVPIEGEVPRARHHARKIVDDWLPDAADTAELLVSELVTNAVKATLRTGRTVDLRLTVEDDQLLIEVWDNDPGAPVVQSPDDDATGGRGLVLVEALSEKWDYYQYNGGKVVWAVLTT